MKWILQQGLSNVHGIMHSTVCCRVDETQFSRTIRLENHPSILVVIFLCRRIELLLCLLVRKFFFDKSFIDIHISWQCIVLVEIALLPTKLFNRKQQYWRTHAPSHSVSSDGLWVNHMYPLFAVPVNCGLAATRSGHLDAWCPIHILYSSDSHHAI